MTNKFSSGWQNTNNWQGTESQTFNFVLEGRKWNVLNVYRRCLLKNIQNSFVLVKKYRSPVFMHFYKFTCFSVSARMTLNLQRNRCQSSITNNVFQPYQWFLREYWLTLSKSNIHRKKKSLNLVLSPTWNLPIFLSHFYDWLSHRLAGFYHKFALHPSVFNTCK